MATRVAPGETVEVSPHWSIESARALYNIEGWGAGFFDVNDAGPVYGRRGAR